MPDFSAPDPNWPIIRQLKSAPNQLTMMRLAFIPFIVIAVLDGHYGWALGLFIVAGISDGLDGLLARWLQQRTVLGQYLDPIADKFLLSTMFLVLAAEQKIPWKITILVFSRDLGILLVSAVLYMTTALRDFSPSIFGKVNTLAQILTLFFVLLGEVSEAYWIGAIRNAGFWATATLTLLSAFHYIILVGQRLRLTHQGRPAAT